MPAKTIRLIQKNIGAQINCRKEFNLELQDLDQVIEQLETKSFRTSKKCQLIQQQGFIHRKFYQGLFRELIQIIFRPIIQIVNGKLVLINKCLQTLMQILY